MKTETILKFLAMAHNIRVKTESLKSVESLLLSVIHGSKGKEGRRKSMLAQKSPSREWLADQISAVRDVRTARTALHALREWQRAVVIRQALASGANKRRDMKGHAPSAGWQRHKYTPAGAIVLPKPATTDGRRHVNSLTFGE